jgi:DNA polymerase-2
LNCFKENMIEFTGWLLDLYEDESGLVLWFAGEQEERVRLRQAFPVVFYAAGDFARLRHLWKFLQSQPAAVKLSRTTRRDVFSGQELPVLAAEVRRPCDQPDLYRQIQHQFPDIDLYDVDMPLTLRYAAATGVFPLGHCRFQASADGWLENITSLDDPSMLDPPRPPLRILELSPDTNPSHSPPQYLILRSGKRTTRLSLLPARPLLINLAAILTRLDPDLLLSDWGDTWLLPWLIDQARQVNLPLPLNRDPRADVGWRKERTYFTYGQTVYRGQQVHLFGRWHIDRRNAMLWDDYDLEGVLESAHLTALPVQAAGRVSPGAGISAIQMLTALRLGICIPAQKQQAEFFKSAAGLFSADQGGLVYQPITGLHRDVAEIDFISMYPAIMVRFNISPETITPNQGGPNGVPAVDLKIDRSQPGLVPLSLAPLVDRRIAYKRAAAALPAWDPRRKAYKRRSMALKWMLVTCFGYLGYKNARFGRIEAHQAVTAYGREALLRAKEAAEDLGYEVLHLYVDGLWVRQKGKCSAPDLQPLLEEIEKRTNLPIGLEGIYRWVAFLASRVDNRRPVANCYFGVYQDGTIKVRGIESRRRDTAPFVARAQEGLLELLAQSVDPYRVLPQAAAFLRRELTRLRTGQVPLEDLVVGLKLSRPLEAYHSPSPSARAAAQLEAAGKTIRPGQRLRLLYTRTPAGVHAWDLPSPPDPHIVDLERYRRLLLRAAAAVLNPFGMEEDKLPDWVSGKETSQRLLP